MNLRAMSATSRAKLGAMLIFILATILQACNAPPLYEKYAEEYLGQRGIPKPVITRLVERAQLSGEEAAMLSRFDSRAVKHLLASNPSIPESLILTLAKHPDEEVRWGVAYNPSSPVATLLSLRTPGQYSTMNEYLARNPRLPLDVLIAMYRGKEANKVGFAMNPNCPPELMREIAESGTDLDRTWLAANPSLPPDLIARLARDSSENVQRFLAQNRAFKNWKASAGELPKQEQ